MPSIHEIVGKMENYQNAERIIHLSNLSGHTNRNVIAYYADFTSRKNGDTSISDADMHGFMAAVYNLEKKNGLDLILHTPGGEPTATESIVKYLKSIFGNDIRAIVPHLAMSAGTMLACSCKEIIMAKHSSLGPIDPQFGGIPALDIVAEFDNAHAELASNPNNIGYWSLQLNKYPAGIYKRCKDAIDLSGSLVTSWLKDNMFSNNKRRVPSIVKNLNENNNSKTHSRHFDKELCKKIGLKIVDLESDPKLQDCVLSVHHCYMYLFSSSGTIKIIENHKGASVTKFTQK